MTTKPSFSTETKARAGRRVGPDPYRHQDDGGDVNERQDHEDHAAGDVGEHDQADVDKPTQDARDGYAIAFSTVDGWELYAGDDFIAGHDGSDAGDVAAAQTWAAEQIHPARTWARAETAVHRGRTVAAVTQPRGIDPTLVAEVVGTLSDAEAVGFVSVADELVYLNRRARLLHQLVDVLGDEQSRYLAQDADDRADRAREVFEAERALGLAGHAERDS